MIGNYYITICTVYKNRIEKRVEERKRKWEEDVENELKQQREAANFRARPANVLDQAPFVSIIKLTPSI